MSLVGKPAPRVRMEAAKGQSVDEQVDIERYAGKWLVLFFYPGDFTFVCPTELRAVGERAEEFHRRDSEVVFVSTDSKYSHRAWMDTAPDRGGVGPLPFAMASDPTHAVCRAYDVLNEEQGISQRATFVIDPDGKVRYELVHDDDVGRSVDELLRVLDALKTGQRCPIDWHRGEATLAR